MAKQFDSFSDFYPYYLEEHRDRRCRRMHFIGSALVLLALVASIFHSLWWLLSVPVLGYGFAWIGHFVFEKNRPATFKHPVYSLIGDWVMFADILRGRLSF